MRPGGRIVPPEYLQDGPNPLEDGCSKQHCEPIPGPESALQYLFDLGPSRASIEDRSALSHRAPLSCDREQARSSPEDGSERVFGFREL